jgi:hypothetical protein
MSMKWTYQKPGEYSDADVCRNNGWKVGTRLVGDEGYGPTVIELTAIGERNIMAKTISHNGKPEESPLEGNWTLSCRDWKVVKP